MPRIGLLMIALLTGGWVGNGRAAETAAAELVQKTRHPGGHELSVSWGVLDNHRDGSNSFRSELTLSNNGSVPLASAGWALYFNFARDIIAESLPPTVTVTHVNGDFYRLEPNDTFSPLEPGASLTIPFDARNWAIKESEAPAGFYLVFLDGAGRPETPEVVSDVHVRPFVTARQTDRARGDRVPVPTPASRYREDASLRLLPAEEVDRVLPTPARLVSGGGQVKIDPSWTIRHAPGLEREAGYLANALEPLLNGGLETVEGLAAHGAINLLIGEVLVDGVRRGAGDEAYRLAVDPETGITIEGTDAAGVLHGIQSLRGWLPVTAYGRAPEALVVDAVSIEDAPRFRYRGMHLDVARNFQPREEVEKLLELMAFYKLNVFHFHLTDDEGWRLEIAGLPELTEVGGRRGHTLDESDRLLPSYGSGPDPDPSRSHGSGHYTREGFIQILRFAHDRHIEVIPEIDVPGHARAAIRAMEARHARLMAQGREEEARAFRLLDPDDQSHYVSVQMFDDNVLNVCQESTYRFLEHVIDDIVAMYAEAGVPLRAFHTGGDEVPHGVWERSPACERLMAADATDEVAAVPDLPLYFLRRLSDLLARRGLITAGWEEIALIRETRDGEEVRVPHPDFAKRGFRPHAWNNVWGWGQEDNAYKLANAGYDVVLSPVTNLYFDLAWDKDPEEPGYYWGGFVDARKPWELVPLDFFKNAEVDSWGAPIDPGRFATHVRLTEAGRRHVLGIQGQLWSENVKGPELMEYFAFPKLLGLAERAWAARPAWAGVEDGSERERLMAASWNSFANRLGQRELPRLDFLAGGVAYRLPPPGAVIEDGRLLANVAYPGLAIHYTTDGTEPTAASPRYSEPVRVTSTVRLKAFDARGRGSRTSIVPVGVSTGSEAPE